MPKVEIYTKMFCPYCVRAKQLLAAKRIPFEEHGIDGGGELRQQMIQRAMGRTTVPQIFIGGSHVGGCDDLMQLEREGRLDLLVAD